MNSLLWRSTHNRPHLAWVSLMACLILLAGCQSARSTPFSETSTGDTLASESPAAAVPASAPDSTLVSATVAPEISQPTVTSAATEQPAVERQHTPSPTPAATPHPIAAYTIGGLREASFPGGVVQFSARPDEGDGLSRYTIRYPSPGPAGTTTPPHVSGLMVGPAGDGPFPVIVLLHGYYERDQYWSGAGTWQAAEYLARHGYLAVIPDYRSWGQSDTGLSLFHTGLVADTLNLLSSLGTLPQADLGRVGLWGHSMGGGVATKVLATDNRVQAAVLYAPNSADDADLIARWGPGCLAGQSETAGDKCNPAEVIPPDLPPDLVAAYLAAAADPLLLQQIAPIYHLESVLAPVQIHIGTADGQALSETPPIWSDKLYQALLAAGKDAEYFAYADQGHFFSGQSWALFMERTAAFFDKHVR